MTPKKRRAAACLRALMLLPLFCSPVLGGCFGPFKSEAQGPEMPASMQQSPAQAASFQSATALPGEVGPRATYKGETVSSLKATGIEGGLVLPDGAGGVVVVPGAPREGQQAGYVDARELKLKIREMAEQLIAGCSNQGAVALPVSFVNQDDLNQTSSFGRFIAEQLFYEFNQRGFPVREYRIPGHISMREGEGDFYLSRALGQLGVPADAVVVAGTYYGDKQAVFVNARLIRPHDGRVLRTANLVLQSNPLTRRMLAGSGKKLDEGVMHIRDYKDKAAPLQMQNGTPFDRGEDIH